MALLDVKTRQKYLKELGFYSGVVDGIAGPKTRDAYLKLQHKYFTKTTRKDVDGKYGPNTDTLLRNAYKCKDLKYFKLNEFRCKCTSSCTGYPGVLNTDFLNGIEKTRKYFGTAFIITSGMRCNKHNESLPNSAKYSRHTYGFKAGDFSVRGMTSLSNCKKIINYWVKNIKNARYGYTDGYYNNQGKTGVVSSKDMKGEVHLDIK